SAVVPRVPRRAGGHPQAGAGGGAGVRRPAPQARGRDHVGGALPRPRRDLRAPRGRRRGARVRPRRRVGAQRGGPARARGHQRRHTHHRRVPRRDPAPLPATTSVTWDPYLDLQSGLLRNRLGITDARALRHVEAELTASRIYDLIRSPIPGAYDLAHLRAFHRQIFQDLYDWAGELRTVSIGRGRLFSLPQHLETDADELFSWLAHADQLRGRHRATFVDDLTELYADLNALHPFRDGN